MNVHGLPLSLSHLKILSGNGNVVHQHPEKDVEVSMQP